MVAELRALPGGMAPPKDVGSRGSPSPLTHDLDAEAAVLGSIICEPSLFDEVAEQLVPEAFYSEAHRRIYEALAELRAASTPIDVLTLLTRLRDSDRLAQVGGSEYVTQILNAAPVLSVRQIAAYARSVLDKFVRRQLGLAGTALAARCGGDTAPIEQVAMEARVEVDRLTDLLQRSEKSSGVRNVLERATKQLLAARTTGGMGTRPSGFDRLDRLTAGLHPELVLLGARPGMGKTSLATAIALNVAKRGEGAFVASLETNDVELMTRLVCAEGRIPLHRCRAGTMTPADWDRTMVAARTISELPIWIDDQAAVSVQDLWAKCRRTQIALSRIEKKLGLVVVDYIQLLRAPRAGMKREEVVAENARALKAMAQDLDAPVLALAQLNRECDKRQDHRPQISDLRESGELEQCARTVLFLYRDDYYRKLEKPNTETNGEAEVQVAKQNNGPTGMVKVGFENEYARFVNLEEGSEWTR